MRIKPNSAKWRRFDYTTATGSAGTGRKAQIACVNVVNNIDRSATRKEIEMDQQLKAENEKPLNADLPIIPSFDHIARDWPATTAHPSKKSSFWGCAYSRLLVACPINKIKFPDIGSLIKPIIARNELETACRLHSELNTAFSYAIAHGFIGL